MSVPRFTRWVKWLFTHPYGSCRVEECDRPRQRWMDYCSKHSEERFLAACREQAQRKFDRDVAVQVEALKRVRHELPTPPDGEA